MLLDGLALHRGEFFAVDQKLLDEPALTGDRGVLLDHQHYHEGVGDNKQNHQDGEQRSFGLTLGDGWVRKCFLGKQVAPRLGPVAAGSPQIAAS